MVIFLTYKTSSFLLNLNKELKLIFSPHQVYDIWNDVIEKKLLSYGASHIFFFHRYIQIGKFW